MAQAQGSMSQILMQMEATFNTNVTNPKSKKVYFASESLARSQELVDSKLIRGSSRHPLKGVRGNIDVGGAIATELMAVHPFYYAALGSMTSALTGASTGESLGSDIAPTAGTIDATKQTFTLTKTSHGITDGSTIKIENLDAPTSLNNTYCPVVAVPDANTIVLRIPMGTSSTYTKGSGTFKAVSTGATAGYTHTLKAGGYLPSYHIEKGFPDISQYFKYKGCKCSGLSFSINSSGLIDVSTDWLGASETVGSSSFETSTTTDNSAYLFDNLMIAAADMKEGSTPGAIAQILSIGNIRIENNLDGDTFLVGGAGTRAAINPGTYKVSGSITAIFEDVVLYNKAINNTESGLDITFKRGTGAGTSGNESLQLVIPELTFSAKAPAVGGNAGVVVELGFVGCYEDAAAATALQMVLKNTTLPGAFV